MRRLNATVTISLRSDLSFHMLFGARHMTRLAQEAEAAEGGMEKNFNRHRSYVLGAVILSANFMEAAINELLKDCYEKQPEAVAALEGRTVAGLTTYWAET